VLLKVSRDYSLSALEKLGRGMNKLIEPHAQEVEEIAIYTATDLESF
jgi:hypothetical protein